MAKAIFIQKDTFQTQTFYRVHLFRKMRPRILAILPALIPSSIILVIDPLMFLLKLGKINLRIRLENLFVLSSDIQWADLIIFCRNTEPIHDDTLNQVLSFSKPYIYLLDDDLFAPPHELPDGKYHRLPDRIAQLHKYINNASLVRVYSSVLEKRIQQYTPKVKCVKAPINLETIPSIPPHRSSRKLKLVYTTSRTTGDNLSQILVTDLIRLIEEFGGSIEVHFCGFIPEQLQNLSSVVFHRFIPDYQKYMRGIYQQAYDIGLAPMINDDFHRSKTNNKFREFGACWIAGIYSNSEIYADCVEHGKTGFLVTNEEGEWYKAIVALMQDDNLRFSIQKNARSIVMRKYSMIQYASLLQDDINNLLTVSQIPREYLHIQKKDKICKANIITRLWEKFLRFLATAKDYGCKSALLFAFQKIEQHIEYFKLLWRLIFYK